MNLCLVLPSILDNDKMVLLITAFLDVSEPTVLDNCCKERSQNPDNIHRWKAQIGKVREESQTRKSKNKREEKRKINEEKRRRKKKEAVNARKGIKVAKQCDLPMICASRGSTSRLMGARLWREHMESTPVPEHFWKLSGQKKVNTSAAGNTVASHVKKHHTCGPLVNIHMSKKMHAAFFPGSTCRSLHVKNTTRSDHFWTLCNRFVRQTDRNRSKQAKRRTTWKVHFGRLKAVSTQK